VAGPEPFTLNCSQFAVQFDWMGRLLLNKGKIACQKFKSEKMPFAGQQ
jgi:hypothetical protein